MFIFIVWICCHSNFQTLSRRKKHKSSSSLQSENENDVAPSAMI